MPPALRERPDGLACAAATYTSAPFRTAPEHTALASANGQSRLVGGSGR
ncbi:MULTISPECIES: hypothetical protein [Streptomyces]|uniref:Uncharacterized protein n=2 Tax=Streptomyces rimosus subsp. rimosus TaxID=132474 RepID=A0A8A1UY94_STRR1|nr:MULTISPECIES: hypothetical protein [Streptomyces]MYT41826.1 hypothetical protein [Streptomyces sp. SID5471]QGY68673.1 hypothetical protein V519_024615 [Streptomyces rimosus R6-500]QST85080.1 hypothetical protein SRIM_037525 [Streptomyces rimosus subsp. rimosus ATCC 10970]UNZ01113.1 hypothetical protein SRIMR7_03070 [Streptomyces rimosus subsp. rimosus]UTH93094.1 hypothetical protein SRIMHP_03065 [Streptomyces rimosus subsp. rimosus]